MSPLLPIALYYSPDSFQGFAFSVTDDVVLVMLIIIHEVHRLYSFLYRLQSSIQTKYVLGVLYGDCSLEDPVLYYVLSI